MNAVERVKKVCKARRIPISTLESSCGFGNGYIGKLSRGTFRQDKLLKIASFLSLSPDYLLGVEDEYGLNPDHWAVIGSEFEKFCSANHKGVETISSDTGISFEKLNDFFAAGIPLKRTELLNICKSLNVPMERVIGGYAKAFETKEATSDEDVAKDSFAYAAHGYSGRLTDDDKATILKMMETLAAANEGKEVNGQTDGGLQRP